ncbi:MAG: aminoacetone oxidase family FAD-binding enzyme, partial [Rikenellaceae bacterium]
MEKPLRKLRITGKGRCNLTNNCSNDDFLLKVKSGVDFFGYSLENFSTSDTIEYFKRIGLKLTTDRGGRVFPASMKSGDVANYLESAVKRNGGVIRCKSKVVNIFPKKEGGYKVTYLSQNKKMIVEADTVVIATGGASYPSTGSTGDGYKFAKSLGHSVITPRPSLVPLNIDCKHLKSLNRLLLKNIQLTINIDGRRAAEQFGELEFFDYGVGGATLLKVSRDAVDAINNKKNVEISIDLKPALSESKLQGRIERELSSDANLTTSSLLRKLVPSSLTKVIEERLSFRAAAKITTLNSSSRKELIDTLKNLKFKVTGYEGFEKAIITAGGVALESVNHQTMQSQKRDGIYIIGELLDLDADTGGYNLQIAFSTAHTAAMHISEVLKK